MYTNWTQGRKYEKNSNDPENYERFEKDTTLNLAAAGPPRQPMGGGHKVAPFTSAMISSQREEIEKRNFAHIFLNT